jgi:hypothetical protein
MWYFYNGINISVNLGTIMSSLHIKIKLFQKTFTPDGNFVSNLFSTYSADQVEKYMLDLAYCVNQGWVNRFEDTAESAKNLLDENNEVVGTWWGTNGTKFIFSSDGTEMTKVFEGSNIQDFVDYFIIFRENFNPQIEYFENNPEEGTVGAWVENSPGDERTYSLYNLPSI